MIHKDNRKSSFATEVSNKIAIATFSSLTLTLAIRFSVYSAELISINRWLFRRKINIYLYQITLKFVICFCLHTIHSSDCLQSFSVFLRPKYCCIWPEAYSVLDFVSFLLDQLKDMRKKNKVKSCYLVEWNKNHSENFLLKLKLIHRERKKEEQHI